MNYAVKYPSGVDFKASGKLIDTSVNGCRVVAVDLDSAVCVRGKYVQAGVIMAMDPRAIITDEAGVIVYDGSKRPFASKFAKQLRKRRRRKQ